MTDKHVLSDLGVITGHSFQKKYVTSNAAPVEIGAVYYRRSNPPEHDWERDYITAREDGHIMFRHWFTWNAINIAPDIYDFESFDKHLELAAKHGIKTIIAEHIYEAPDWLYHRYPHARRELANGNTHSSCMGDSNATGITRMCLDNKEVLEEAKKFLYELARHYRDVPGLYGYDIWNECSLYNAKEMCYCPASQAAFREWLKREYGGNLNKLRNAWRRYSLTSWDEIEMPRHIQPYPDTIDMVRFQNDNAQMWMEIRESVIREADPKHYIAAHGNAKTFSDLPACGDDYRAAEHCDIFGYTFWYGNRCHAMLGGDMTRLAAGGKEFWRAEAIGNSDWQGRGGRKTPILEKEEMSDPNNIRLDAMMSFAAGARGYLNPRWRALQDGGLFDAFGWYNLDGSRSERSEEVKQIARWADSPSCRELWTARPIRGEIGLLLIEEAQILCYAMYGDTDYYSLTYQGAYEAFLHVGVQADPIRLWQIDDYKIIYAPFPTALSDETLTALTKWVENGGTLIAEGCFGYFSAHGHAYERQPSRGLDKLIGASRDRVSFGPDMWHELELSTHYGRLAGGVYRQSFIPDASEPFAFYDDGEIAGVESDFGEGKVRVIGTMAGYGYKQNPKREYLGFFSSALPFAGTRQLLRTEHNTGVIARVWANESNVYLWCLNTRNYAQRVLLAPDNERLCFSDAAPLRGGPAELRNGLLGFLAPAKDAVVYKLS